MQHQQQDVRAEDRTEGSTKELLVEPSEGRTEEPAVVPTEGQTESLVVR